MRQPNVEGTVPKNLIVGRRYHVAGWKTGANFVLDKVDDEWAVLHYPKRRWKSIKVATSSLRNTYRHRKHQIPAPPKVSNVGGDNGAD